MLYEPRESINPRTFALRHALLEELKRRQVLVRADERAPLVALARALDVMYDTSTRQFVVGGTRGAAARVPLDSFRFYDARTDVASDAWHREDEILRANRALAARVVDQLLAPPVNETP
jgi:hypothetical protein